jgi:hypothetical protein
MDILRVERDGAEFFNVVTTGIGGISGSGISRICTVDHRSIERWAIKISVGTSKLPKCLEALRGQELELGHRGTKNSRLFLAPFCAGMIEYYAFEADKPTEAALFAYRKFAKMGIEQWIRSITGWTPPQVESAEDPKIILPNLELSREAIRQIIDKPLSPSSYRLYLHLHDIGQLGQRPRIPTICKHLKISHTTFYKTARKLKDLDLLPDWVILETRNYPESFVRDWLHRELGGQIEAPTPYGPIDLLTDDSVIEVKAVEDWKEAIGHVIVKTAEYPKLTPCLMLFGDKVNNFNRIQESCQRLKIELGCLLVKYVYNEANELQEVQRIKAYC